MGSCWLGFLGNFCENTTCCCSRGAHRQLCAVCWELCEHQPSWEGRLSSVGCQYPGALPLPGLAWPLCSVPGRGVSWGAGRCPRAEGRWWECFPGGPRAHPCFASQAQTGPKLQREIWSKWQKFLCLETGSCAALGNRNCLLIVARCLPALGAQCCWLGRQSVCRSLGRAGGSQACCCFLENSGTAPCADLVIPGTWMLRRDLIHRAHQIPCN